MPVPTIAEIRHNSAADRKGYEKFLDYFANYVVKAAIFLHITPTQISFFWVIVQFFAPLLFLLAEYRYFVLGIVLFQLMFIVDLSDGKLYRFLHFGKKPFVPLFPEYLDRLGHFINNSILFICLGVGIYLRFGNIIYLYVGLGTALFYLGNKAISLNPSWFKNDADRAVILEVVSNTIPRSGKSKLRQFVFDFLRMEHLGSLLFFGIIFDYPQYTLVAYALFNFLEFCRKLLGQARHLMKVDKTRV